jgi:hypothetical protein
MDACATDADCEVWATCCAYCFPDNPNTVVVSVNKKYAAYASLLTLTFYCPSCAEGGCNMSPPKRAAICKAGTCMRRDSWTDDAGKVSSVEVPNDPTKLELTPEREIIVRIMEHSCRRAEACNVAGATGCDQLAVPHHLSCDAADRCFDAIDHMTCPTKFDIFSEMGEVAKLPACAKLDRMCP